MMERSYRNYIIDNFFVEHFLEQQNATGEFLLEETDEGGKTLLHFKCCSSESVAILNVDKQHKTLFNFFKADRELSLNKRVDHIVLEEREGNQWIAHLVEISRIWYFGDL